MSDSYGKETLSVEFKSDVKRLPDADLLDAVVALTNTEGGVVYLGVEDDGTPTGLHKAHMDAIGLTAMIANRTVPPVAVRAQIIGDSRIPVMRVEVPASHSVVATKSGKILRRSLKIDGTPESIPMYPYEIATRLSDLGKLDFSAQPVLDASIDDFDPMEYERLRRIIGTYQASDKNLLELSDDELSKSLQLTTTVSGQTLPTVTGLLLLGKEESIRRLVPTHEGAFQVLSGTEVRVNQSYRGPLLKIIEQINDMFKPWNPSEEFTSGLFSVMIPEFDQRAFREALINAFGHRDYSMLGRVRVQVDDAGLTIANPGGFVEGIDIRNLLTAEPHGRNPCLMDALKRSGLAERTGRGIDRIYEGSLHYGRPLPDYSASNERGVSVFLQRSAPDPAFMDMIAEEQERSGKAMSLNALLVLNMLKEERRCSLQTMCDALDVSESRLRATLGQLTEAGLVEGTGSGKRRVYTLGAKVYKRSGKTVEYVRQKDIDRMRYAELILRLMEEQGSVTTADVMDLLHVESNTAYYQISKLVKDGKACRIGKGKKSRYIRRASDAN